MIEATNLTKRFGKKTAVDDLTVRVLPGRVTGFLGPNGAGKSTTMRLILGLDHPTSGHVTVNGKPYAQIREPLREVGALLDARAAHNGRTARGHLRIMAATQGLPAKRADEMLEMTGLTSVANQKVGSFSLGMEQRLGIAVAMLGDPETLILDEPVNGLDPEGILWVRHLVRGEADRGKTVLLSSHLMSEMQQVADQLIILGKGKLLAEMPMTQFIADASGVATKVVSPQWEQIRDTVVGPGITVTPAEQNTITVEGLTAAQIGDLAARYGWVLHELTPQQVSLEGAYLRLTEHSVEYTLHDYTVGES